MLVVSLLGFRETSVLMFIWLVGLSIHPKNHLEVHGQVEVGVISRVTITIIITHTKAHILPLTTTHEPPRSTSPRTSGG